MKTILKSFSMLAVAACAGMSITSCNAEKDFFDPSISESNKKAIYAENFKAKFGAFSADQSWDFTKRAKSLSKTTRSVSYDVSDDYINVEDGLFEFLRTTLPAGQYHRNLGTPFIMTVPYNSFDIIPVYQGVASFTWDLHLMVGDEDIKFWSKGQNFRVSNDGQNYIDLNSGSAGWWKYVKTKSFSFSNLEVGAPMYFVLSGPNSVSSSLNGGMIALSNYPRPDFLEDDQEIMAICIEDCGTGGDGDMDELVFLIVGHPEVPKPIDITTKTLTETISKRYMMEDLGDTDDFDFNDVVVDVTQSCQVTYEITNGKITNTTRSTPTQKAYVRAMGGTLDFSINIGETSWTKSGEGFNFKEMINTKEPDYDKVLAEFDVYGWDPDSNNVAITVKQKAGEKNGNEISTFNTISFPAKGEVPLIIATDLSEDWNIERQSIIDRLKTLAVSKKVLSK